MRAASEAAGVHAAVGLQSRGSPTIRQARARIASGAIGRVLSVRAYSSTAGFGPDVPEQYLYLEDPKTFANLVTIQGAHTVDLAIAVAGGLAHASALASAQYPEIKAGADGHERPRTTFDHLLVQARLATGGALSVEVAGGRPPETPFRMEIVGEGGVLTIGGGGARGLQASRLTLSLDGAMQAVDEGELAAMPDPAVNVAGLYAALRDDIARGTATVPGFDHALRLTRLVTDLLASSEAGARVSGENWPRV